MSFTCPRCNMTSHNPNDEREGYCGNCHDWTGLPSIEDMPRGLSEEALDRELALRRADRWAKQVQAALLPPPKAEDIASADLFLSRPDPFARAADIWVGNNDGSYMAWWKIEGVWHWRHLSVDNEVLAEGEGRP